MAGTLLDTHVALWVLQDHRDLGPRSRRLIASGPSWVSAASVWEIAIKQQLGKLTVEGDLGQALADSGLRELAVTGAHALGLSAVTLPQRDPFDRMLVSQAQVEGLALLTADRRIHDAALPFVHDARQ